jgi:hypothetical protein
VLQEFIKHRKFLDQISDYYFYSKDSTVYKGKGKVHSTTGHEHKESMQM